MAREHVCTTAGRRVEVEITFEKENHMRILLTGGAGYVGSACLRWLLAHGHEPFAYDDLSEGNRASVPAERLIEGSIEDRSALEAAMRDTGAEAVMHFAALASVPDSIREPERYWRINVFGTKNILDAMVATDVKRILFSSTAATYSFENPMPLIEEADQVPRVPYGTTKLACERMIQEYSKAYGPGYAILRYFNAAGADPDGEFGEDRRHETHLIPLILQVPVGKREHIKIYGDDWETRDGTCVRDYVHTSDLAQAHQLAVEALVPGTGEIFNVGSGDGVTVGEVHRACEEAVGEKIAAVIDERRPGDPAILIASSQKLQEKLGWKPQFPRIQDIVRTAWEWHRRYPSGYADKVAVSSRESSS